MWIFTWLPCNCAANDNSDTRGSGWRICHVLSFIPSSQPPRPPSLPHPSSLLSSLTFFFCNFFSVVFGSSLYFENPVPFLFFFFSNIDTQTVQPTRNFYFCKDREGKEEEEEGE